jgi:DNA-binding CsgD family transcriptional regulator
MDSGNISWGEISKEEIKEFLETDRGREVIRPLKDAILALSEQLQKARGPLERERILATLNPFHVWRAQYEEILEQGGPVADYLIAYDLDGSFSDEERMSAARRILQHRDAGPPIFMKQWAFNEEAFKQELENLELDVEAIAERSIWQAVREVIGPSIPRTLLEYGEDASVLDKATRAILQRIVPEYLFGPKWESERDKSASLPVEGEIRESESPAGIEALVRIELAVKIREAFWDGLETWEQLQMLEKATQNARLSESQHRIIQLRREGLSHREIAEQMGITEAASKKQLSRAIAAAKEAASK